MRDTFSADRNNRRIHKGRNYIRNLGRGEMVFLLKPVVENRL
jgi:hypothetical protein